MVLDWNRYCDLARKTVSEGVVLLKNENEALPLKKGSKLAVFGRMQNHYYKSGTGSGGMVNVSNVVGILDALLEDKDICVNQKLMELYSEWEETHCFDEGIGWGNEPWSQEEMTVAEDTMQEIAKVTDVALVIIARTAGEDKDNQNIPGAYQLSVVEMDLLSKVRNQFQKVIVVYNIGAIMDMGFMEVCQPDAILYAWQGGMVGGLGVADVLTGRVSPSGKLTDTIACSLKDYPSNDYFGDEKRNIYAEDIYVGYRYFETVAMDKVKYPFGFGLSYTEFVIHTEAMEHKGGILNIEVSVQNTGAYAGKEVVQIYVQAPQGRLGKPSKTLAAFQKTKELQSGEVQVLEFGINQSVWASYDTSGITGCKSGYVLEQGIYQVYAGNHVRNLERAGEYKIENTLRIEKLTQALTPEIGFQRMKPIEKNLLQKNSFQKNDESLEMEWEQVIPCSEDEMRYRNENLPQEISYRGNQGYKLLDVKNQTVSMENFIAQLSDQELACIVRGEGMGSPKVTPGTAAAFGGVSNEMKSLGIPCGCCSDGPSGMRLDCGTKAFSLPNGTLIACTFNTELIEQLYECVGWEMTANKVDVLLGPGMNIHRHPLNGRNFEYFSEDPLLTGKMAAAQLRGLHKAGVEGTLKHFCANNQETKRMEIDSVVSERALREIYLKGFEIAVKEGQATSVMTTYGGLNGIWTAGRYDLNTRILRNEWGFEGIVMTDWWASMNQKGQAPSKTNFAAMIRAQNDLYMVCPDAAVNSVGDNTLESLQNGTLSRGELQRSATNICRFLMGTHAFTRMNGLEEEVTICNRPKEDEGFKQENVVYYKVEEVTEIPLAEADSSKGSSYVFALDVQRFGDYYMEMTAKSELGELAQIPITVFANSTAEVMFTWNGTKGEWMLQKKKIRFASKYTVIRLYFGQSGVELKKLRFVFENEIEEK